MKYVIDHDLHIHSQLSLCSRDPLQNPDSILKYGIDNGFKQICITDHFWDERVPHPDSRYGGYMIQTSEYISQSLPLPQSDGIEFLFGGECDMDKFDRIGISREFLDKLDFLIVPINHLHVKDFTVDTRLVPLDGYKIPDTEECIKIMSILWVKRFRALLDADLPFKKIGIAHLQWFNFHTDEAMAKALDLVPDENLEELFSKTAEKGAGVELNFIDAQTADNVKPSFYRLFETAKRMGCKFYFGSDAHHPREFENMKENFATIAERLGLEESDKFHIDRNA